MSTVEKLEQHEHVRRRPDMYFGDKNVDNESVVLGLSCSGKIVSERAGPYYPGILSLLSEPLVNAFDAAAKDATYKGKKFTFVPEVRVVCAQNGWVEVTNVGLGMPVRQKKQKDPVPQMCFGSFFSGSNFNDSEERFGGGRNGVGAAVVNVMSKEFEVDVYHPRSRTTYTQKWIGGQGSLASRQQPPVVQKHANAPADTPGHVTVRFRLDLDYFYGEGKSPPGLDLKHLEALRFRTACASHATGIRATFNGSPLSDNLAQVLAPPETTEIYTYSTSGKPGMSVSWWLGGGERVSLVNGVDCPEGTHTSHAEGALWQAIRDHPKFQSSTSNAGRTSALSRIGMLVSASISRPQFASNSKRRLVTPARNLGFKWTLPSSRKKELHESELMTQILNDRMDAVSAAEARKRAARRRESKRNGGRKVLIGVADKLVDARNAGKKKNSAFLMVTEGDSAASLVHAGRPSLPSGIGSDNCGSFVLRGKLLNVRNSSRQKAALNKEISGLVRALGLCPDRTYTSKKEVLQDLRYHAGVVVLSDQDTDGSHIAGLVCNALEVLFPSVCALLPNFVRRFVTPVVIATPPKSLPKKKSRGKKPEAPVPFFSLQDYHEWKRKRGPKASDSWTVDYYKGLATSSDAQARQYFAAFRAHILELGFAEGALEFAFGKNKMADRKRWLMRSYDPKRAIAYEPSGPTRVSLREFVETDVAHFWQEDNRRSLPHLVDGLKVSQRKAVHALLTEYANKHKLITIERMANRIADVTNYHHGGKSMEETITRMAQDWVGAPFQNLPLLQRAAQFGTRWTPASVHGASRYLRSLPHPLLPRVFPPADLSLLPRTVVDGARCEPEYFVPVIPLVLVNGVSGIGTGFSTSFPPHDPVEIVEAIAGAIHASGEDETLLHAALSRVRLTPSVHGFTGPVSPSPRGGGFLFEGVVEMHGKRIVVTELPLIPLNTFLESCVRRHEKGRPGWESLSNVDNQSGVHKIRVVLDFEEPISDCHRDDLPGFLGLRNLAAGSLSNMHCWSTQGELLKLSHIGEVFAAHGLERVKLYHERRERLVADMEARKDLLRQRVEFARHVVEGRLSFSPPKTKAEIEAYLDPRAEFSRIEGSFNHLTGLPLSSLTKESMSANEKKYEGLVREIEQVRSTSAMQMWSQELQALLEALTTYRTELDVARTR